MNLPAAAATVAPIVSAEGSERSAAVLRYEQAASVWRAMLDADMNARYWRYMCLRFSRRENWAKIFLAATSSATVASWSLWGDVKILWQSLSVVSALVSVSLPIFDAPRKIAAMVEAQSAWQQLTHEYEALWHQRDSLDNQAVAQAFALLRKQQIEVNQKTATLPLDDEKLALRCWNQVMADRGLNDK